MAAASRPITLSIVAGRRATIIQIEARIRCVIDYELICLAKALNVTPETLLPPPQKVQPTTEGKPSIPWQAFAERRTTPVGVLDLQKNDFPL